MSWHDRVSLRAVTAMSAVTLAAAIAASVLFDVPSLAPGVWVATLVFAAGYRFGPRGVIPVAMASVAVIVARQSRDVISLPTLRDATVLSAWFIALGMLTSTTFHLLWRRLQGEHDIRVAEVASQRNEAVALVHEREVLQRQLTHTATHDPLTGLANRLLLIDRVQEAVTAARQHGHQCGVMSVDLDDFKPVNDLLGHAAGDDLLRVVAQRLQHSLREEDVVARLGGDEFAVVFRELPADACHNIVRRVVDALNKPVNVGGRVVEVKASVGLALSAGDDDAMALIGKADMAMYAVKTGGKNDIAVYEAQMHQRVQAERRLDNDLHHAVERDELRVFYQPVVDLSDGRLLGFEALLRWQHPEQGMVPPDRFIPLAERNGTIVPIGTWVLAQACRQLRAWQQTAALGSELTVAVNLSAKQLTHPDVVPQLRDVVVRSGVDPRSVVLEVTESLAMETDTAAAVLWELRALGMRIALDDFGTGYSSLSRLGDLPLDKMKIDKSFVLALADDADARTAAMLIRSSVAMAHGLGYSVVAEGVERPQDVALLRAVGCDQGQGFLFCRPVPAAELDVTRLRWALPGPDGTLLSEARSDSSLPRLTLLPSATRRRTSGSFRGLAALQSTSGSPPGGTEGTRAG